MEYRRGVNVPRLAAVPPIAIAATSHPGLPCAFALNEISRVD
jgi:hypothetical protein